MSDVAVLDTPPATLSLETPETEKPLSLEKPAETTTTETPPAEVNWRDEFKAEDGSVPKSLDKYKEKKVIWIGPYIKGQGVLVKHIYRTTKKEDNVLDYDEIEPAK